MVNFKKSQSVEFRSPGVPKYIVKTREAVEELAEELGSYNVRQSPQKRQNSTIPGKIISEKMRQEAAITKED